MRVAVAGVHDAETRFRQARVEPRAVRTVAVDVEPQRREPTGRVGRDLPEAGQLREGDGVRAVANCPLRCPARAQADGSPGRLSVVFYGNSRLLGPYGA